MDCSTIIVSYDTFDLTAAAIRSALAGAPGLDHEVIVVDNASPDESERRLREAFAGDARVHVLGAGGNVGFAAANNAGARRATGRVLFFLNPDTLVLGDAVATLVAFVDAHPEAGAVGPRVLNEDRSVQPSAMRFPSPRALLDHRFPFLATRETTRATAVTPTDAVSGCALAVARAHFDAVGGWDERYFMYSEEIELCLALSKRGLQSYLLPSAQIVHYGGRSSLDRYAEQQVMLAESEMVYLRRHAGAGLLLLARLSGIVGFGGRAAIFGALSALRPHLRERYRHRGEAAAQLLRYYLRPARPLGDDR